jgi:alpha-galactosidase
LIELQHCGLHLAIEHADDGDVRLLHFSASEWDRDILQNPDGCRLFRLVELQASGENQLAHHGSKYLGTAPANRLKYVAHRQTQTPMGPRLEIEQSADGLSVTSVFQFVNNLPIARTWTELKNQSATSIGLEYVSSFALTGIMKEGKRNWEDKTRVHIPHNAWNGEIQWQAYAPRDLGLAATGIFSTKRIACGHAGTWPSSEFLPLACVENTELATTLFWQIEHNGSWHWEIGDRELTQLVLRVSGPTHNESHWWKQLAPGETFLSVPVAVGSVQGNLQTALQQLTHYRRAIRRPNPDNQTLPIIFNCYMNCLGGDPTEEKLLPLIDAASDVGCEYFVIDAGWYGDGDWWSSVGMWEPSAKRFPQGIPWLFQRVRDKGMTPGLWLEVEVMGINCPLAQQVPDDWFFQRHGKRVIDHGRYQLDFRNPDVRAHAHDVVDRMVRNFAIGYLKMDYNIEGGVGTEYQSDSLGDGLLEHNRAYLTWLNELVQRHPQVIFENCASGGMRIDYATLSVMSIQSTSDQTDYRKYAPISAASPSAVTPEQSAVWSYPQPEHDQEAVAFNMLNAIMLRVHQAGKLDKLSPQQLALVKAGLDYYKSIRGQIPHSLPFWPLGLPVIGDAWACLGLTAPSTTYLSIWRLQSDDATQIITLPQFKGQPLNVQCAYPPADDDQYCWDRESGTLTVTLPQPFSARLYELRG